MRTVCTLLVFIFLLSCDSNSDPQIDPENLLIGHWVEPKYEGETITYQRASNLKENAPGVSFKSDAVFIQRTSGWCGTPPLTFYDEEGTWNTQESLILINSDYFPGNLNWRIISLNENQLVIKRELSEQEKDHRDLMDLFNEISELANSVPCTDASDWSFTAYGSKACGGPQGYIAYSNQIDTVAFLEKVEAYRIAEHEYNIKWSIYSTCDLAQKPTTVECQNGYPVLIY